MKKLLWTLFIGLAVLGSSSARADIIDAAVSADNNVSYWNSATSSWVPLSNTWPTVNLGTDITTSSNMLYLAVSNDYTSPTNPVDGHNPTGLVASFIDTNGKFQVTGTNTLLSSSSTFQAVAVNPWITNPPQFPTLPSLSIIAPPNSLNPTLLTGWSAPNQYGANGNPSTLWTAANGGPLTGIDPNAEWLSLPPNTGYYTSTTPYQIFGVNLAGIVTPEPSTVLLFAFGLLALAGFAFRRKFSFVS